MILYKYLPLSWSESDSDEQKELFGKRCECIRDNIFWFSTPSQLNDPYDCHPHFILGRDLESVTSVLDEMKPEEVSLLLERFPSCSNKEELRSLYASIVDWTDADNPARGLAMWAVQQVASEIVNAKISNIGVLSLSENPQDIPMWAHYASNHAGACIEIEIPADTRSLKKVTYTDRQPELQVYEAMHERHGRLEDMFYTKSTHWSTEREWRMVSRIGGQALSVSGAEVTKVIYGINASEETKNRVREIVGQSVSTDQLVMQKNYELAWKA